MKVLTPKYRRLKNFYNELKEGYLINEFIEDINSSLNDLSLDTDTYDNIRDELYYFDTIKNETFEKICNIINNKLNNELIYEDYDPVDVFYNTLKVKKNVEDVCKTCKENCEDEYIKYKKLGERYEYKDIVFFVYIENTDDNLLLEMIDNYIIIEEKTGAKIAEAETKKQAIIETKNIIDNNKNKLEQIIKEISNELVNKNIKIIDSN